MKYILDFPNKVKAENVEILWFIEFIEVVVVFSWAISSLFLNCEKAASKSFYSLSR
jgi:hypothetical protein